MSSKVEKTIRTPRIRARLNIVKLPVPPVILRPTLQGLEHSKSSFAQPMSREVTFFWSQSFTQIYCVNPYSKCTWYTTNCSKTKEIPRNHWKKWLLETEVERWRTHTTPIFSNSDAKWPEGPGVSLCWASLESEVSLYFFHFWRHCTVLTQDLSTAFSSRRFNEVAVFGWGKRHRK